MKKNVLMNNLLNKLCNFSNGLCILWEQELYGPAKNFNYFMFYLDNSIQKLQAENEDTGFPSSKILKAKDKGGLLAASDSVDYVVKAVNKS